MNKPIFQEIIDRLISSLEGYPRALEQAVTLLDSYKNILFQNNNMTISAKQEERVNAPSQVKSEPQPLAVDKELEQDFESLREEIKRYYLSNQNMEVANGDLAKKLLDHFDSFLTKIDQVKSNQMARGVANAYLDTIQSAIAELRHDLSAMLDGTELSKTAHQVPVATAA